MTTDYKAIKTRNYLHNEANGDAFRWLLDYCNAIPDVAKKYIETHIECIEDAPTSEEMDIITTYFRGFQMITYAHPDDNWSDAARSSMRELSSFFYEGYRYRNTYIGNKFSDNHPCIMQDGEEKPLEIFQSPLACFVGSLTHTFNAMCTMVYFLSKSSDKEKYAIYAENARYVFKSFYDTYLNIASKNFDTPVDVYIIPEGLMNTYKYVATSFSCTGKNGKERTYWCREKMFMSRCMSDGFNAEFNEYDLNRFKIW